MNSLVEELERRLRSARTGRIASIEFSDRELECWQEGYDSGYWNDRYDGDYYGSNVYDLEREAYDQGYLVGHEDAEAAIVRLTAKGEELTSKERDLLEELLDCHARGEN